MFVLTHHEHGPIEMAGGTTFHFVTDGFDEALRLAREAGDWDVDVSLEPLEAEHSPRATHVRYRVRPSSASRHPGRP